MALTKQIRTDILKGIIAECEQYGYRALMSASISKSLGNAEEMKKYEATANDLLLKQNEAEKLLKAEEATVA